MKKYLHKISFLFLVSLTVVGCSDFLDVVPQDKILESQLYSSETGVQNVHNGLYLQLASNNLYGKQLTMDAVEILAQQYNIQSNHEKYTMASYNYAEKTPKATFTSIWETAFTTILSANKFLESIEEHAGVISAEKANMLKGEAIAIRAMLHFDMLRLYGPIYKVAPADPGIPYYDKYVTTINPILPANDVIAKVLADLDQALTLLANDPVLTTGKYTGSGAFGGNPYYSVNRGNRMNYLAVKCLKARVLLYSGDKTGASTIANEVINFTKSNTLFPWTAFLDATNAADPDRIFSSENFFALSDYTLYTKQKDLFDSSLEDRKIYSPLLSRINAVFESNDNDYRSLPSWKIPIVGGKTQKTFFKYEDVSDKTKVFRLQIPMFKLSEMYLIAAETSTVPATGISYLNTLRFNRGLGNLAATAVLATEVTKEYRKEFIGEGQLFFYYKRINSANIPNGAAASGNLTMNATQYVVPLPDSEINFQ
ncbi:MULTISPECIES: RagB/SusD family nutrient uptake outer membrane protein [Flavobacterium]|uniref:SusD family protein n=1 Tax=Flavobacterium anhuiense TaxID=459526 RepID=A0ABY0LUH2_9FLAO|nr:MULTISPECIES: RagB/SusD family nutrient uptake outer membrane protein [Flavobacterium]MXO05253.1 RagB/SusD family nutrient uptake outer membrane protein [Flavobacterium sp. HBTb2-11-1]SCY66593.1 SusD family protein [Flavobacterium anhuiense]